MKIKSALKKATSLFLVMLFVFSVSPVTVWAEEIQFAEIPTESETETAETTVENEEVLTETPAEPTEPTEPEAPITHALILTCESLSVKKGKTVQMTATVTNVDTQPKIVWRSSNMGVATVDDNGLVKGIGVGKATITAKAVVGDEVISGEFTINVITSSNFLKDFLVEQQVLSYQYSYEDDYYYTNDKEAWQYDFGFGKIYDLVSPYILLEYDYVRVFFIYGDKDWMLQMWKGQYGLIFYGGEVGIYNRDHVDDGMNEWTFFNCPAEEDWLDMEMTLWHEDLNGNWNREFTREYDKYWWCTGFKNGHLRQEEPADELRMTGRITFLDEEMAKIVADGLIDCGFTFCKGKETLGVDQIYLEGKDIYYCWQEINDAESTMFIKVSVGFLSSLTTLFMFPMLVPIIVPIVGVFGLACILVSFLL